jgi:ribonuclease Z
MASRLVDKTIGTVHLQGFSVGGEETVVALPEMNLAFDVGRAPREIISIDHVCLTHGHMDHSAGLAYYFSQRNFQGISPGCVIAHHKLVQPIQELMQVWGRIEGHVSPARIVGVDEDEDFELHQHLVVRPFRVRHSSTSLGFAVIDVRKKLKPEYAELSSQQIVALKKSGTTVEYRLEVPKVAYCGDTALGNYLDHEYVKNAEVLIVECTFFEPDHLERARQGSHTHVVDLPELYQRNNSPHVVLSHVSRRTGIGGAKRYLREFLSKEDLARTVVLMDMPRVITRSSREEAEL